MNGKRGRLSSTSLLACLILCALLLTARLVYLVLSDAQRYPINTVKIGATYEHIDRKQLESILSNYLAASYFTLSTSKLYHDLTALDWADTVEIERIWPDTLKITIIEKIPAATWNGALMTVDGELFNVGKENGDIKLPHLSGPAQQQMEVLQIYQKLSKLLSIYGLHAAALQLRENQAWELTLANGVQLHLGKRDLEQRLQRFCKAYPAVFADKPEQLFSVDLRYARGMAVQWKQQTER
jgi:cell division protein FtsQ